MDRLHLVFTVMVLFIAIACSQTPAPRIDIDVTVEAAIQATASAQATDIPVAETFTATSQPAETSTSTPRPADTPTVSQALTSSPTPTRAFKGNTFVSDDVSIEISKCFLVKHDKDDPFGFLSNIFDDQTDTVFNADEDILFVIIGLISSIRKDVEIKWSLAWLPQDGRDGEIIEYSQIVRREDYFPSIATPGYAIQSADGTVKTILPLAIPPKEKFVEKGDYQILTSIFEVDGRIFELANCGTNYTMQ